MSSASAPDPRPRTRSLAVQLTAWYALSAFLLVALVTSILYWSLAAYVEHEDAALLTDEVQVLRLHLAQSNPFASLHSEVVEETASRYFERIFLRVLGPDDQELIATPDMGRIVPMTAFPVPSGRHDGPPIITSVGGTDGTSYRLASATAVIAGRGTGTIQIALDNRPEVELVTRYRQWMLIILALTLVVCSVGSHVLVRRGLRPLNDLRDTVGRIGSGNLSERVGHTHLPAELASLAATFNAMLDRLEDAFSRLSRFSADIAHELRTPVNNLRGEVEVALGKTRSGEEYREVLGSCAEECQRLAQLIDTLLFLARAERPEGAVAREDLHLAHELRLLCAYYDVSASDAGVTLVCTVVDGTRFVGDRILLQRALGNLIENALAHTSTGGRVTITAQRKDAKLVVTVSDTGCGIPPEHLPHVFERFYRIPSRNDAAHGRHVGLGLALVRSIASLHGGTVAISSTVGVGTTVTLRLAG